MPNVRRRPPGRRLPTLADRMSAPKPLTAAQWRAVWAIVSTRYPNLPLTAAVSAWADYAADLEPTTEGDPQ